MREGDGLEVHLLWSKSADRVKVTVADARSETVSSSTSRAQTRSRPSTTPSRTLPSESFGSVELERETLDLHTQA